MWKKSLSMPSSCCTEETIPHTSNTDHVRVAVEFKPSSSDYLLDSEPESLPKATIIEHGIKCKFKPLFGVGPLGLLDLPALDLPPFCHQTLKRSNQICSS